MFNKKKCFKCKEKLKESYSFCPGCGTGLSNSEKDVRDFGMLGKNDEIFGTPLIGGGGMGITENIFDSLIKNLAKTLDKQMRDLQVEGFEDKDMKTHVKRFPNGISIRIGGSAPDKNKKERESRKSITEEQIARISKLPKSNTKADVKRFGDKVIYEVKAPDVQDVNDIFVSKLETGYEIKAIGKKKVYVVNIPINLPLKGYSLVNKNLNFEFGFV